ncbi:phosphate acyltransferase PlsX [Brochothrix thermosphacta]|uniref:phosphate acyltransferase PlsX n=1 Tax=Brochothrix thermosphacta TaxID=2756 RepID=UPI00128CA5EF|nr:phosphate acyltransferase PlsX [Brochothrix thermosphacta]MPQ27936.1 phosphate acyltransferase PlsX [Brochothrix thermosphacta]
MKIAIDAMGGDHAPQSTVEGVMLAAKKHGHVTFQLYGDKVKMAPYLEQLSNVEIVHTEEKIESTDSPVEAVRKKKQASMVLAAKAVKDGEAEACISAGNTGALMSAGLFVVGRMKGIKRPALAPTIPTVDGSGFVLLDAGANADAKPEHLLQFGMMGSAYVSAVKKIERPRVGLLNIGTEHNKGTDLTKDAFALLDASSVINFVGNVEARDLLNGVADVVVTDGFTGNMVLKTIEGTAGNLMKMIKGAMTATPLSKLGALTMRKGIYEIKDMMDYSNYGGACLFGLAGTVVKAHGSSNAHAIATTVTQAIQMVEGNIIGNINSALQQTKEEETTNE